MTAAVAGGSGEGHALVPKAPAIGEPVTVSGSTQARIGELRTGPSATAADPTPDPAAPDDARHLRVPEVPARGAGDPVAEQPTQPVEAEPRLAEEAGRGAGTSPTKDAAPESPLPALGLFSEPARQVEPSRPMPAVVGAGPHADAPPTEQVDTPEAAEDAVEVVLRPEDLGRVKLTMAQDGDMLRVTVQADRPETLELMRRHSDQLGAELRHAGFAGASFSFGGRDGQPQPRGRPVAGGERTEPVTAGPPASVPTAGLDLRI